MMDATKCDRCGRYATLDEPRGWSSKRNAPAYGPVCHRCYDDFTAPMDDVQPRYTEAEHLAAVARLRADGLPRLDVYTEEEWPSDKTREIVIETRARAFSGRGVETIRCRMDADGSVLVWDSIAGHFTRCHSLGESAIRRIRRLAKAEASED